jgi:ATP-dependent Clp protease ATP-binding subunit ClpA
MQNGKEDYQEELLQQILPQELLNYFDLIVPFRKLSVEDYYILFTRKIESLKNMLRESKDLEIFIDEATSLNIVISLVEQSGSVRKFLRKMEQVVIGRILQYLELHQEKTTITIAWHDNTICIL